jgi:hypothetical protein
LLLLFQAEVDGCQEFPVSVVRTEEKRFRLFQCCPSSARRKRFKRPGQSTDAIVLPDMQSIQKLARYVLQGIFLLV